MQCWSLTPAYARVYGSVAEVTAAFNSGKDFRLRTINGRPPRGLYCSVRDINTDDEVIIRQHARQPERVTLRYDDVHGMWVQTLTDVRW